MASFYAIPHLMAGARHVVPASAGSIRPSCSRSAARSARLSTFAAPTIVRRLVDHAERGADARTDAARRSRPSSTAARRYVSTSSALAVMGPRFVQIYGQGDADEWPPRWRAPSVDAAHPRHLERLGLSGRGADAGARRAHIADGAGRDDYRRDRREVLVKGDSVMAGYWRKSEATKASARSATAGSSPTTSAASTPTAFTLKDRQQGPDHRQRLHICPREEEVLLGASVAEAAVVGARVPDAEWGGWWWQLREVPAASAPASAENLLDARTTSFCGALQERPSRYEFLARLPGTALPAGVRTDAARAGA